MNYYYISYIYIYIGSNNCKYEIIEYNLKQSSIRVRNIMIELLIFYMKVYK